MSGYTPSSQLANRTKVPTDERTIRSAHVLSRADMQFAGNSHTLGAIRLRKEQWRARSGPYAGLSEGARQKFEQSRDFRVNGPPAVHNQDAVPIMDWQKDRNAEGWAYDPEHHILHRWGLDKHMKKAASLTEAIAGTINRSDFDRFEQEFQDPTVAELLPKTACVMESLSRLTHPRNVSGEAKLASAQAFSARNQFDVVQVRPQGYGYVIKWAAAPEGVQPQEQQVSVPEAQQAVPQEMLNAADQQGVATVTNVEAQPDPMEEQITPAETFGMYKVYEAGTGNQLVGFVIPGLFDPRTGQQTSQSLFTNGGQFALQQGISGVLVAVSHNLPEGPSEPRGMGVFYKTDGKSIVATIPFNVMTKVTVEGQSYYSAQSPEGMEVQITPSEGLRRPVAVNPSEIAIPSDFVWLPLNNEMQLEGQQEAPADPAASWGAVGQQQQDPQQQQQQEEEAPQQGSGQEKAKAAAEKKPTEKKTEKVTVTEKKGQVRLMNAADSDIMAHAKIAAAPSMVEIRAWRNDQGPGGGCDLSGPVFEKVGSGTHSWADGIFWLAAAGMPQNLSVELIKQAASTGQAVRMYGLRPLKQHSPELKEATASAIAKLAGVKLPPRHCLLREAVAIGMDKEARALVGVGTVDNLLALNFINPENVGTFVEYLPDLEDTASKLASLVFATQVGLQGISKTAAIRAMTSLEEIITGLKSLQSYSL